MGRILGWMSIDQNWPFSRRDSSLIALRLRRGTHRVVRAYGLLHCNCVEETHGTFPRDIASENSLIFRTTLNPPDHRPRRKKTLFRLFYHKHVASRIHFSLRMNCHDIERRAGLSFEQFPLHYETRRSKGCVLRMSPGRILTALVYVDISASESILENQGRVLGFLN